MHGVDDFANGKTIGLTGICNVLAGRQAKRDSHISILITCQVQSARLTFKTTSIDSTRSSAYNEDIHWQMVWQTEALGHSYREVARNLCVDQSTVCRTVSLFPNE